MDPIKYYADKVVRAAKILAFAVENTPEEYRHWKPVAVGQSTEARSAIDQVVEVATIYYRFAAEIEGVDYEKPDAVNETMGSEDALAYLAESASVLSDAIKAMDPARLMEIRDLGFVTVPFAVAIDMAHNNAIYHFGQINYIQYLLGDTEFKMPPIFAE